MYIPIMSKSYFLIFAKKILIELDNRSVSYSFVLMSFIMLLKKMIFFSNN